MQRIIYILALFLMLASCYDDKGNYDYTDINTVGVGLDEVYPLRLDKDTILTIVPRLAQSLQENQHNLKYLWLHSTTNHNFYGHGQFDTAGIEKDLRFHVDPNEKDLEYEHYFRLNVYDELTGIEYPVNTTIKLVKPYDGAWMILHRRNGQTELGSVEYIAGKRVATADAYYKETGNRFQGKPLCLGQFTTSCKYYGTGSGWNMFSVITDIPREAGVYCQWKKFEKMDSLSRMVAPMAQAGFEFQKMTFFDGGGTYFALALSDGILYQSPRAMKVYKPKVKLDGAVEITHAAKVANISLIYDKAGHRFGFYNNTSDGLGVKKYDPKYFTEEEENADEVKAIPVRDNNVKAADPNRLNPDQQVLYVGAGYNYNPQYSNRTYAYGVTRKGVDSCFIYEFDTRGITSGSDASFSGYYRLKSPKGLDEHSCFASSFSYSGILYYASGNTIYRFDFKQAGGKATPVYTHAGGKAVKMNFARKTKIYEGEYEAYEFDPNRSLGVIFDTGTGKSDFVILNLSETGGIGADSENYPAIQVYPDFGEIKDFVFI